MTWAGYPDDWRGALHNGPGATPSGWLPTVVNMCRRGSDPACASTSRHNCSALSSGRCATAAVTAVGIGLAQLQPRRVPELVDLAADMSAERREDDLPVEPANQTVEVVPTVGAEDNRQHGSDADAATVEHLLHQVANPTP